MINQEYIKQLKAKILELLPDNIKEGLELEELERYKEDEGLLHGIVFKKGTSGMVFYIERILSETGTNASVNTVAQRFAENYVWNLGMQVPTRRFDLLKNDLTLDNVRDHLTIKMVSKEGNESYLADKPHIDGPFDCFALVAAIDVDEFYEVVITYELMETLGCDAATLFKAALEAEGGAA